jgi:hypothetical protein
MVNPLFLINVFLGISQLLHLGRQGMNARINLFLELPNARAASPKSNTTQNARQMFTVIHSDCLKSEPKFVNTRAQEAAFVAYPLMGLNAHICVHLQSAADRKFADESKLPHSA